MTEADDYSSPAAVEQAIGDAARNLHRVDNSLTVGELIRIEYFNRFLSRVFSEGEQSNWVLKGGTGMLARVRSARVTTDVDLLRLDNTIDSALGDLRRLASSDLGDFFRFVYIGHRAAVDNGQQPYVDAYRVSFDIYIGAASRGRLNVDLVVNAVTTGIVDSVAPANALGLPRLRSHNYRVYPVVDQIADKVCATLATYSSGPSSRQDDLVDLVILATTQAIASVELRAALRAEAAARRLTLPTEFDVPAGWGAIYEASARRVPACKNFTKIESALTIMRRLLDPILSDELDTSRWDPSSQLWV